jgi:transcriptional regulator with XRE-family HTH domain
MTADRAAPSGTFAARLTHLITAVHPRGRPPYTDEEIAQQVTQVGVKVSREYIRLLRTGGRPNPSFEVIGALAQVFGVDPSYFFDEATAVRVDEQLDALALLRDEGIQNVAMRANGLSTRGLQVVLAVIEQLRNVEGLSRGPAAGEDMGEHGVV